MNLLLILKGIFLGFAIAAPVGPIGLLCIRKTLHFGRLSGFFSGLGAAVADTIFGCFAAFGLTALSSFLITGQFWLRLIGGAFLIYIGIKTFLTKPVNTNTKVSHKTLTGDFVSTLLLTLSNPMTIFSFLAAFSGVGLASAQDSYLNASVVVLGVFIGSTAWWLILCEGIAYLRKKISHNIMPWINRFSGILIGAFGIALWISLYL